MDEIISLFAVEDSNGTFNIDLDKVPRTKARMLIRSIFSAIEGIVYSMKQVAASASQKHATLTIEELTLCYEKTIGLSDKGKVELKKAKLTTLPNLQFAFAVYAKAFFLPFTLDVKCDGWRFLVKSIEIRDRFTHPKRPSDLKITNDELRNALNAYQWFNRQVGELFQQLCTSGESAMDCIEEVLALVERGRGQPKAVKENGAQ